MSTRGFGHEESDKNDSGSAASAPTEAYDSHHRTLMYYFLREIKSNRLASIGALFLILIVLLTLIGPFLAPYSPYDQDILSRLQSPSSKHWFGTDELGRDVFTRLVYGGRVSLFIGIVGTLGGLIGGIVIGLLSGYWGGRVDLILMRVVDIMYAFPGVLLAILIVSVLGPNLSNLIVAISIWGIPTCSRIIRGTVLSLKEQEFIDAARSIGASSNQIMVRHLLANCAGPIIVYSTLSVAGSILTGAALGFLGLGVQPPMPEWGAMLSSARQYVLSAPSLMVFPGLAIFVTVLTINFIGDALRDAVDPQSRTMSST